VKIIGITGGIGSGKSTICSVFKTLGAPVFNSDYEAKQLYFRDSAVVERIRLAFGEDVFLNGTIQTSALASKVFDNPTELAKLNSIVHPAVAQRWKSWLEEQEFPYVIREAAILIESGSYKDCDAIVLVTASFETKIGRVMRRDNLSQDLVEKRMQRQWSDEQLRSYCNHEIINESNSLILPDIFRLDELFMA
jgi:dephospho-CoA kinase